MRDADIFKPSPSLTSPQLVVRALQAFGSRASSPSELWESLTDHFAVDLDLVASLLPAPAPEPAWAPVRAAGPAPQGRGMQATQGR